VSTAIDLGPPILEKELTTYISADLRQLYERAFLSEQGQTGSSLWDRTQEGAFPLETWKTTARRVQVIYYPEPSVIRFYEDIIAELQRELAKYKELVFQLLVSHQADVVDEVYSPGEPTTLPARTAEKLRRKPVAGLPMVGHEI
jgi:hypothetical protein